MIAAASGCSTNALLATAAGIAMTTQAVLHQALQALNPNADPNPETGAPEKDAPETDAPEIDGPGADGPGQGAHHLGGDTQIMLVIRTKSMLQTIHAG